MRPGGRGLDGSIGGRNPLNPPGPGGWRPSGNGNPVKKKQDWLRTDLRAVYRGLVLIKCKFSLKIIFNQKILMLHLFRMENGKK